MGLCASLLKPKAKKKQQQRYTEPRRGGMPKALFVVRGGDRRQSRPETTVVSFQPQDSQSQQRLHRPAMAANARSEKWRCQDSSADALPPPPPQPQLDRRLCAQLPRLPMPCGGVAATRVAVEPVVAPMPRRTTATNRGVCMTPETATATDRGVCMTPAWAAPMTPMRPVWQRRILMGMRCELPRFSGLILYDEHGRPMQSRTPTPGRRNQQRGKKKTSRTSTLRDLL